MEARHKGRRRDHSDTNMTEAAYLKEPEVMVQEPSRSKGRTDDKEEVVADISRLVVKRNPRCSAEGRGDDGQGEPNSHRSARCTQHQHHAAYGRVHNPPQEACRRDR